MRYTKCLITGRIIEIEDCKLEFNKIELAWAAGFFDGEGHTGFSLKSYKAKSKRTFPSIKIEIKQIDTEVLVRFKNAVKRGLISGPYTKGNSCVFLFEARTFEKIQFIMCQLWSYLSSIKKEQYRLAIQEYLAKIKHNKDNPGVNGFAKMWENRSLEANVSSIN